ncbi:translation initiation factor IF-2 [Halanaerobiaceae bacterium Z-7014]|uniref:Translation initiation factor IF-2 n=1 Tax=Halonatronomonas betaini TaxID=2778430 RepID=A0A931F9N6_9FIRM|nr:translation initiation factor IF-2 [Halonatronomonas betaini]MBF8436664.1 translation initiation factor IF-2 [Halonatronomonas betaini]
MGKIRVYSLAKELNMESKELVDILQELDVEVTSHMSTVEDDTADLVRGMYSESETDDEEETGSEKEKADEKVDEIDKEIEEDKEDDRVAIIPPIKVKDFAEEVGMQANTLLKDLMGLGIMGNINYSLDEETLELLIDELDLPAKIAAPEEEEDFTCDGSKVKVDFEEDPADYRLRSPIVTVMGHVDHGKTTLLDMIRKTRVTESEAGGITQHIGAYQAISGDQKITFIDTPGHEAFTAMRARGAQLTDIAILVVAADDGIMPQTVEAINHAKAADIPLIVAVNKIDKPNAQPDRVKQELTEHGLVPEEWGGKTICVEISALKGENIDELMEMVLLVAEMEDIKANPNRPAEGVIIEAELDKGRGAVATVLVKNGSLKVGDPILAGSVCGRVKALVDEHGNRIDVAGPAMPVEVLGFNDVPKAGDFVQVLEDEKRAREISEERQEKEHQARIQTESKVTLEDFYDQIQEGELQELNLIIKADVQGSIEALRESLLRLSTDEVGVNVIHTGVGAINETDVNLASASNAIIIGFNVRPGVKAQKFAEKENVDIRMYRVIYKALEDIKNAMSGLLDPEIKEVVKGHAEVRATFSVPDVGIIAGVYVTDGEVNRNYQARLLRDSVVIHEGEISSLKRFENDVREVKEGYECGVGIANYNDIKEGDIIEFYDYKEIERTL